jgi:hypothetical protein
MSEPLDIDISNDQMVGTQGNGAGQDIIVMFPKNRMTKAEALRHAAWLVALSDDYADPQFPAILEAVNQT